VTGRSFRVIDLARECLTGALPLLPLPPFRRSSDAIAEAVV